MGEDDVRLISEDCMSQSSDANSIKSKTEGHDEMIRNYQIVVGAALQRLTLRSGKALLNQSAKSKVYRAESLPVEDIEKKAAGLSVSFLFFSFFFLFFPQTRSTHEQACPQRYTGIISFAVKALVEVRRCLSMRSRLEYQRIVRETLFSVNGPFRCVSVFFGVYQHWPAVQICTRENETYEGWKSRVY